MTHIATKHYKITIALLLFLSLFSSIGYFTPSTTATYTYTFNGPYEDGTTNLLADNATVTAHFTDAATATYSVYNVTSVGIGNYPAYFEFSYNYSGTMVYRYYWLSESEQDGGTFDIFFAADLTEAIFNIFNFRNIDAFSTGAFLISRAANLNPYGILEKVPIDELGNAKLTLKLTNIYDVSIETPTGSVYSFGNLNVVSSSMVLTVPSSAFPNDVLLEYPYVTFYGYRNFATPTGSIIINYNDTKNQTSTFTATITDSSGVTVYSYSVASTSSLILTWSGAVNATIYYANVVVDHALYGEITWRQTFPNQAGDTPALFDFSFLGDWAFNTAYIIPALIILFIACCFSVLNAEVGAVLAAITAIVLTYIGWLPIPAGMLVAGLAFAILMALVYNKRRTAY